ncbi:CPBP family intramembrane metalloprotease [Aquibacillus halophilus]|uniref:CPBP family intramembrane metalloprotease n=1 Tax=Aquibacillus halophilus TaxID=930132 RepID=A0A6A8DDW6_9BACI|nr:type II CAAX endopeptidase family protein [Aquibacillus halophilus]MRH43853.1 CPBP family intramembrane metalloprotease [Aquibacillus halophilus]
MREIVYVIILSVVACLTLYFLTQIVEVNYALQTILKVCFFVVIPIGYVYFVKKIKFTHYLNWKTLLHNPSKLSWIFAISTFTIILIAYFFLGSFVDFNSIASELREKSDITASNFIFIGLYITFGNSLLEELFFRGFIFKNLYHTNYKKTAYLFSSLLFALYHIAIFKTWFNIWLIILCTIALFAIGMLFNWLNANSKGFMNSWIIHIFADAAIIIVGFRMFDIF